MQNPTEPDDTDRVDLLIVGGGINGVGIARDAVGRGYSVCLAEMNDLSSGTSSWSTKLIHGGLRYLEHYEFRLVREALTEREVLWGMTPHITHPMRFVLPHHSGMRPAWLLRLGLFLYDHIGGRKALPPARTLDLRRDPAGDLLKDDYTRAFEYSDCATDDNRLVILNAMDAREKGADIRVRTKVTQCRPIEGGWEATLTEAGGAERTVRARMLVNAAGPWVDSVLGRAVGRNDARNVRLVQGSHIVVRRLYDHDRAYFFQNGDGRIFFAIPYHGHTLIGTTDRDYDGDPGEVRITEGEIDYLLDGANGYLQHPVRREDIVWSFSGVRPLYDDGASEAQEATRDYVLETEREPAPLLNIFGGKLTTYRRLAESALDEIGSLIGAKGGRWTQGADLPGGDFEPGTFDRRVADLVKARPFLDEPLARRLFGTYGTRVDAILGETTSMADLGRDYGGGLTEAEVDYLASAEWARTGEDVLWRRTKLGLDLPGDVEVALDDALAGRS